MIVPKKKKKTERLSHIPDTDVMKIPVNGCTLNKRGRITKVYFIGCYCLNVANRSLTNPFNSGERQITIAATRDAVRRAELWRKCWDACSSE